MSFERLSILSDPAFHDALDTQGFAVVPGLLSAGECADTIALYEQDLFRKRIIMGHHGYGEGEYQYFRYPLPDAVANLRAAAYPPLAVAANRWRERLGEIEDFPDTLEAYTTRCHQAGQVRPTPLLLKYEAGGYNRLHQDLYGEEWFPFQMAVLLSAPGEDFTQGDFTGGEFILTEQKPRSQSRAHVVPLAQGDAVVFAVNYRPTLGKRGYSRRTLRHGVSTLHTGNRYTLGIIFHDAK